MRLEDYPLTATRDARSALAGALARYVSGLEFGPPASVEPWRFRRIYPRFAQFQRTAKRTGARVAAVLPGSVRYEPIGMTPRVLEHTWSGGDPRECDDAGERIYPIGDGSGDGFALVEDAECVASFVLTWRTRTSAEQEAVSFLLEQAFIEDETLLDVSQLDPRVDWQPTAWPVRSARLLTLPDYYKRRATFSIVSQTIRDDATSVRENRWVAEAEIEGRVGVCTLRRVRGMRATTRVVVDGAPAA